MTDHVPSVLQALAAVMADVDKIEKEHRNPQQGYSFRGVDDVMNALHGPLARHGVLVMPNVQERLAETRETAKGGSMNVVHLRIRFDFHGPAGDCVSAETWGEAQDSGDKATNKALSAAFKYAILQVFCVPTQDMGDADSVTVEAAPRRQQPPEPPARDRPAGDVVGLQRQILAVGERLAMSREQITHDFAERHEGLDIRSADVDALRGYLGMLGEQAALTGAGS